jgi:parallel beta-helix repeat protein
MTLQNDTIRVTSRRLHSPTGAIRIMLTTSRSSTTSVGAAYAVGHRDCCASSSRRSTTAPRCRSAERASRPRNTVSGAGFTGARGPDLARAALDATAPSISIVQNTVTGHRFNAGVRVEDAASSARLDSNVVSTNNVGVLLSSLSNFTARDNDIFDNTTAGVRNEVGQTVNLSQIWWGDPRGPRGLTDSTATGDSLAGTVTVSSSNSAPLASGTSDAALRTVRGDGQTAPRATALAKAFTVRVVDAAGRPVAGASHVR